MSWNMIDSIRITHKNGHVALVEVPYRSSWWKAKALAMQMLRGKLWAAPGGPADIPAADVQLVDLSAHGQEFWNRGGYDVAAEQMAADLGERLGAKIRHTQQIAFDAPTQFA
jgi:hypothetical protein